jgi:sugar phosphate permease
MTRKGFHILLALTLVFCVLCPYVEFALDWNQTIFNTGYDTETTVAVIALLLILTFALARLLVSVLADRKGEEALAESHLTFSVLLDFISTVPDVSPPPLPLRV